VTVGNTRMMLTESGQRCSSDSQ